MADNIRTIRDLFERKKQDIAFIIGNGINRYPNNPKNLSWDGLLINLWNKVSEQPLGVKPEGISMTEFYDVLELENRRKYNLQKEVVNLMKNWEPLEHHKLIVEFCRKLDAPILTTNFDETLSKTDNLVLYRTDADGFTDFYPWSSYYGDKFLKSPSEGFGIWHINGMLRYHRSIRLGLSQYMGSVERTRNLLYKGDNNLFFTNEPSIWRGNKSWLDIIFNKSLFIFGISLDENEVFLRWLLIQRIKYFKKYPDRLKKGWYLTTRDDHGMTQGKRFFLERVGIKVIEVDSFKNIYHSIWR